MESGCGWLSGDWPSTGVFSTLLRWPGLRASSDGVLATKSERKMLASTCLYSFGVHACTRSMPGFILLCNFWKLHTRGTPGFTINNICALTYSAFAHYSSV